MPALLFQRGDQVHLVKFDKDDPASLICPACRGNYLHHDAVTVFTREREDGPVTATTVTGDGVYRKEGWAAERANPSSRRDGLAISFWCESCSALSELTIAQHKGCTLLEWRVVGHRMEVTIRDEREMEIRG
jgi:hypothetical protein